MEYVPLLVLLSVALYGRLVAAAYFDRTPDNYYVGNWSTTSGVNYTQWAQGKTFYIGDTLTFTVTGSDHSVVSVSKDGYDNCRWSRFGNIPTIGDQNRTWNITTVPRLGDNYYISSSQSDCNAGVKLAINVSSPPPSPAPPTYNPVTYTVGDGSGWNLGVNFAQWVSGKKFYFGDSFKFVFNSSQHTLVEVLERGYQYCNESYFFPVPAASSVGNDGNTTVTVVLPVGKHYYTSSVSNDCQQGLKVNLEILPTYKAFELSPSPSPSPSPSEAPSPGNGLNQESSASLREYSVISVAGLALVAFVM